MHWSNEISPISKLLWVPHHSAADLWDVIMTSKTDYRSPLLIGCKSLIQSSYCFPAMNGFITVFSKLLFASPLCGILCYSAPPIRPSIIRSSSRCSFAKSNGGTSEGNAFSRLTWQKGTFRNILDGTEVLPALHSTILLSLEHPKTNGTWICRGLTPPSNSGRHLSWHLVCTAPRNCTHYLCLRRSRRFCEFHGESFLHGSAQSFQHRNVFWTQYDEVDWFRNYFLRQSW